MQSSGAQPSHPKQADNVLREPRWRVARYSLVLLAVAGTLLVIWPSLLQNLFASGFDDYAFMPHGHCYLWVPQLWILHVTSDTLIGFSYVAISLSLAYLVYRARRDIPFHWVFLAFGLFIIACGATHFMEVWTLWNATYWLSGYVKLVTAVASLATALVMPPLLPKMLALVRDAKVSGQRKSELENTHAELKQELAERKRAEASLNELQKRFRGIYESSTDAIGFSTLDGVLLDVNNAFANLTGYSKEELLSLKRYQDITPVEYQEREAEKIQQVLGTGEAYVYEKEYIKKDGSCVPVAVTVFAVAGDREESLGLAAIVRDITERKQLEALKEREFALIKLLQAVAVVANEAERSEEAIQVCLDLVCKMTAWDIGHYHGVRDNGTLDHSRLSYVGNSEKRRSNVSTTDYKLLSISLGIPERVLQSGKPLWSTDLSHRLADHGVEIARDAGLQSCLAFPVLSGQDVVGVMEFYSGDTTEPDIHLLEAMAIVGTQLGRAVEREHALTVLRGQAQELARSNADLEQFAYVASHDLQEPLRMVASYTQLLARRYRGRLDADADDFINYAVDGANRMQTLINDLLAFSRINTKGQEFAPIDCNSALTRALDNLKHAIDEAGATVTRDVLPTLHADPVQIIQLFQNLIGNAVKFHDTEPPQIHISARRQGEEWRFSISDNGIGIEPQFAERIFIIFQRLHGKEKYSGTGIGLAICKRIVERHEGRIWVESERGQGSTFHFTIPVRGK